MRPIAARDARNVVCVFVTAAVSPANTAESIQMPFEMQTRVGLRTHLLDGGPDAPTTRGTLGGHVPWATDASILRTQPITYSS